MYALVDPGCNKDDSNHANTSNDGDKPNSNDDGESVIIEEVISKVIDLNEESDEDIELENVQDTTVLPNSSKHSTNATEFVIVNAANLSSSVMDVMETAVGDIQIKDELSESIAADLNTNDVLENDPMDLLELNHRSESSSSIKSQEETDFADDGSSIGSSSIQTGSNSSISVLDWIRTTRGCSTKKETSH
ncbi:hypothetical protein EVAR_71591_1 [Eumeta japonica]|uniref:Uncharacterized protein n=1 Tax=Eumeta variegata TaxID=151549 RepID=A0A4C1TR05_EUMVA|nr:hypothetical protein EVAR_71591_1 [Eumeta japonica]